jgi:hypothetical protein
MEAAIHSSRSKLGETIKHWVEDVLSYVNKKMQGLNKELTRNIDETHGLAGSEDRSSIRGLGVSRVI